VWRTCIGKIAAIQRSVVGVFYAGAKAMAESGSHHEFGRAFHTVKGSSDRGFGFVFATVLALLAAHNLWREGAAWRWEGTAAAIFLALALLRPAVLAPLNRAWQRLGLLLGHIVTPFVLGGLFFLVVTPVAMLARLAGKDFLRLRGDPVAETYWIVRDPPGPAPETMRDQF